jgi:hypothetical protein
MQERGLVEFPMSFEANDTNPTAKINEIMRIYSETGHNVNAKENNQYQSDLWKRKIFDEY